MLALWDTFVTDILCTVRHSRENPQGDEHQRCIRGVLEETFALGWTMIAHIIRAAGCVSSSTGCAAVLRWNRWDLIGHCMCLLNVHDY